MNQKPLNKKAYGSIAHLPGSRMDASDKILNPGQVKIITQKTRDRHDYVIATEKLDGSCVSVAKIKGLIIPLVKDGYHANTSPYKQHHIFVDWVAKQEHLFQDILNEGERVVGEWLAMAHGIIYDLGTRSEFVVFDIFDKNNIRNGYSQMVEKCTKVGLQTPPLIKADYAPISYDEIKSACNASLYGGEKSEGIVIRVERDGIVDFLGKYVVPEHICGKYFVNEETQRPIWNIRNLSGNSYCQV